MPLSCWHIDEVNPDCIQLVDPTGAVRAHGGRDAIAWTLAIALEKLDVAQRLADTNLRIALAEIEGITLASINDAEECLDTIRTIAQGVLKGVLEGKK